MSGVSDAFLGLQAQVSIHGHAKRSAQDLMFTFSGFEHLLDFMQTWGLSLSVSDQGKSAVLWKTLKPTEEPVTLFEKLMANLVQCEQFASSMESCMKQIDNADLLSLTQDEQAMLLAKGAAVMLRFNAIQKWSKS